MSSLTSTCNDCGFTTKLEDDRDVNAKLAAIDAVHDAMRPDCKQAIDRAVELKEIAAGVEQVRTLTRSSDVALLASAVTYMAVLVAELLEDGDV